MKEDVKFKCDRETIRGKLYRASFAPGKAPTVLLLHGFPGNVDDVLGLGEVMSSTGLNVLTFNYRGTYQSEGEYSLRNTMADIVAAFDYLKDEETINQFNLDPDRLILGGYSYGGGMGLIHAAKHRSVNHVFSIAGTDHGEFAREYVRNRLFADTVDRMFDELQHPKGPVKFAGSLAINSELIRNPDPYDLLDHASNLADRNVLLIGGWDDQNVTVEKHILPCYRKLKGEGSDSVTISVFQDNHSFESTRMELAKVISNWIEMVFSGEWRP